MRILHYFPGKTSDSVDSDWSKLATVQADCSEQATVETKESFGDKESRQSKLSVIPSEKKSIEAKVVLNVKNVYILRKYCYSRNCLRQS